MMRLLSRLGCLLVLAGVVAVAWAFREPIATELRRWSGSRPTALPSTAETNVGAPTEAALRTATEKGAQLVRADGPQAVTLTPNESAALVGAGLDWTVRRAFDSLRVELLDGRLVIHARLETSRLPQDALGLFGRVLESREPVQMGGILYLEAPGRARWRVETFQLRSIPAPRGVVPRLVERVAGGESDGSFAIAVPTAAAYIRISPVGLTLEKARGTS